MIKNVFIFYLDNPAASIKVENWTSETVTLKVQKPIFGLKYYMTGDQKAENWHVSTHAFYFPTKLYYSTEHLFVADCKYE